MALSLQTVQYQGSTSWSIKAKTAASADALGPHRRDINGSTEQYIQYRAAINFGDHAPPKKRGEGGEGGGMVENTKAKNYPDDCYNLTPTYNCCHKR